MYEDKLDGKVTGDLFERKQAEWREEQTAILARVEAHQDANRTYMEEGVELLALARRARSLFECQEPREQRRLLDFVLSNSSWADGELTVTYRQPFDLLADATASATVAGEAGATWEAVSERWLPGGRWGFEALPEARGKRPRARCTYPCAARLPATPWEGVRWGAWEVRPHWARPGP